MTIKAFEGCIIGAAVGDSLGLPYEGLSLRRASRLFPRRERHHFLFGRGMISDDTEHALMVAQAVIDSGGDPERFSKSLARRLRWWFLGLPAGIGLATLRACLKLCVGVSPHKSGVFSAGNGPAMRSAIIGVMYGADIERMKAFVRRSTIITHTDPKAYIGAFAVALAAHLSATGATIDGAAYLAALRSALADEPLPSREGSQFSPLLRRGLGVRCCSDEEFFALMRDVAESISKNEATTDFYQRLAPNAKQGISGYIYHTVPAVIHAWLRHPANFKAALLDIIACGGDTDTTGAILGAIIGARVGVEGIPRAWIDGILEYPESVGFMKMVARQLEQARLGDSLKTVNIAFPLLLARNFVFAVVVLYHGFRRLLPPY
ncbi:ADP-ribosylation/Crystallin J1 [Candidatus Moduliflexus flocculans]|uniref:ADP-ribosylation/Crystallin J1 n=1 Tax=Candidatus Moduliflexus flocculans TaxID=1499966 RepID=A0A0S6VTN6_9BACT|nr:ADP-ribosylation/Crystallin J1 [Candidatus Moduliflexus flocculans]